MVLPSEMGSLGASVVPTTPSPPPLEPRQSLTFVDHGGSMTIWQAVFVCDNITEVGKLAQNSKDLFTEELCNLFIRL